MRSCSTEPSSNPRAQIIHDQDTISQPDRVERGEEGRTEEGERIEFEVEEKNEDEDEGMDEMDIEPPRVDGSSRTSLDSRSTEEDPDRLADRAIDGRRPPRAADLELDRVGHRSSDL